jgi:DNA-binding GntR family transcriptional regulator
MTVTDTQKAYELLQEKIVTTEMPPGSVIHEAALMTEIGLGRTPIREALKMLEAERLVTVSPRRGMFVTTINISDLAEIQEVRSVLDLLCVRLAAQRMTPAEVAEMRALLAEVAVALNSGKGNGHRPPDMRVLMALDLRFHRLLARSTRNSILISEIEMLYNLSRRIWYYYLDRLSPADLAFDAFPEVVDALEQRDEARAERALSAHIADFSAAIRKCL